MAGRYRITAILLSFFFVMGGVYAMNIRVTPLRVHYVKELGEYWAELHVKVTEADSQYTLYGYVNGAVRYKMAHSGDIEMDVNLTMAEGRIAEGMRFEIWFEAQPNGEAPYYSNAVWVEYHDDGQSEMWVDYFGTVEELKVENMYATPTGKLHVDYMAKGHLISPYGSTDAEWQLSACKLREVLVTKEKSEGTASVVTNERGEWAVKGSATGEYGGVGRGSLLVELVCENRVLAEAREDFEIPPPETKEKEAFDVEVDSPYDYEYNIEGNYLMLTIHVNYVAKNSCYGVRADVVPMRCPNCYEVFLEERVPKKTEVCAEVIREVPTITVRIGPLSGATERVYVRVHPFGTPELNETRPNISIPECMRLEAEIVRLERYVQRCLAGEGCEDLGEVKKQLDEIKLEFEKKCKKKPPKIEPVGTVASPEPEIEMPKPIRIGNVEVEINKEKSVIRVKNVVAEVETKIKTEGERILSAVSGKEIKVDPAKVLEKIRERIRVEVKRIVLRDTGTEPVYEVEGEEEGRLLGILPVRVKVRVEVDAEDGEVKRVKKPWWSFLVWG